MDQQNEQRAALFDAVEAGDLAALDALFKNRSVLAMVEASEPLVGPFPTTANRFQHPMATHPYNPERWYNMPSGRHTQDKHILAIAIRTQRFEVIKWFYAPTRVSVIPNALAYMWESAARKAKATCDGEMLELLLNVSVRLFSENERLAKLNALLPLWSDPLDDMIQILLAHGAEISDEMKITGFLDAAVEHFPDVLVAQGAVAVGASGWTQFDFPGSVDGMRRLLKLGVDTGYGTTPLHASLARVELVELLVREGWCFVDIDARDAKGRTALMLLSDRPTSWPWRVDSDPEEAVAAALIRAGADVTLADHEGKTALHHCASTRYLKLFEVLLKAGADPNAADNQGKTVDVDECRERMGTPLFGNPPDYVPMQTTAYPAPPSPQYTPVIGRQ